MTAPTPPQPLPLTGLANLIGVRPPWSWSNLTDAEARDLDDALAIFVSQYNAELTTGSDHIVPACWRKHPPLRQNLPVLYWAWWDAHRNQLATIRSAVEFHGRHLPAFQERLNDLLGGKPNAGQCRASRHEDAPNTDKLRRELAARAANATQGPDVIDTLIGASFGT